MNIFFLEDDSALQRGISLKLNKEGHNVQVASNIAETENFINLPDMAILDINLPDGSGLDYCKTLRIKAPHSHILMLTAMDGEADTVLGYDFGADDYMTKPFSLSILLSKITAVERKMSELPESLISDNLNLTKNENRLLITLIKHQGQILTKEQLLTALWDIDGNFVHENTLAVNISRLREKLSCNSNTDYMIENIRSIGYRLKRGN